MSREQAVFTIAERVGLLKPCRFEICDEFTWDEEQLESAYRYAATIFKKNDPLTREFKSQKELTDWIKALEDNSSTECACDRQMAKD